MKVNSTDAPNPRRDYWTSNETELYDILSNTRRRECVRTLLARENGEQMDVWALAERVATSVSDDGEPDDNFEQSVYVSLTQTHLSRLDAHEIVEYDADKQVVSPGPRIESLDEFVLDEQEETSNWSEVKLFLQRCWPSQLSSSAYKWSRHSSRRPSRAPSPSSISSHSVP